MSVESVSRAPLDIGAVLGDSFTVIGRTFVVLANISVMFLAIPAVVRIAGVVLTPVSPAFTLLNGIGTIAHAVGTIIATNAILQLAMQDLHGQPTDTGNILQVAARKFWPVLGLVLLVFLGVALGCILLIVPGIILALAWSAAQPALVLEDRGVFGSFKRSLDLTRGKRWSIFLLYFLVGLIAVVIEVVLQAFSGGLQGLVRADNPTSTVISSLLSVIFTPFSAVLSAALFNQLRGKAGYGAEAVAEVFA
jgi:hypothetical protein